MNCLESRQTILTDPYHLTDDVEAHLRSCTACANFKRDVLALDSDVEQALNIPVPEGLAARTLLAQSLGEKKMPPRWLSYGAAASLALALVLGGWLLLDGQTETDSIEVVEVGHEHRSEAETAELAMAKPKMMKPGIPATDTDLFSRGDAAENPFLVHAAHQLHEFHGAEHEPITPDDLELLMAKLNLTASIESVVYAAICPLGDEKAAHLVIKDGEDQYTVMLLPERSPAQIYAVDDMLWRGFISPHPAGALAVLADVKDAAALLRLRQVTDKLQTSIYLSAER